MANTSISNLAAGAAVSATDLVPNVQAVNVGPVKTTAAQLKTFMSNSPTLVTPTLGVATGTSLALGGATLGSNVLATTGLISSQGTLAETNNQSVFFYAATRNVSTNVLAYGSWQYTNYVLSGGTSSYCYSNYYQLRTTLSNSAISGGARVFNVNHVLEGVNPTGTISEYTNFYIDSTVYQGSGTYSATITNTYGLYVVNQGNVTTGVTKTNAYGVYISAQTGATNNYGIFSTAAVNILAGNFGAGAGNTSAPITITASDGTGGYGGINYNRTSPNNFCDIYGAGQAGGWQGCIRFLTSFSTGATIEAARIDHNQILNVCSAVATPAGGSTSARMFFGTTANFGIYFGSGAPTVSAAKGSLYLRSDGTATNDRMYINTDGSTTWTAVTTAA